MRTPPKQVKEQVLETALQARAAAASATTSAASDSQQEEQQEQQEQQAQQQEPQPQASAQQASTSTSTSTGGPSQQLRAALSLYTESVRRYRLRRLPDGSLPPLAPGEERWPPQGSMLRLVAPLTPREGASLLMLNLVGAAAACANVWSSPARRVAVAAVWHTDWHATGACLPMIAESSALSLQTPWPPCAPSGDDAADRQGARRLLAARRRGV